ncbi:MAG: hypothetical protein PUC33_08130 [Oscillospiraceae bacterium]|nr:hypothetical protein [Oscillospiraceae bacterium]MDD6147083.1 hypothetical protein [Oscillospiraceae bacterium]
MNEDVKNETVQEPDWSLHMFWEDITDLIQKLIAFIKSLFNYGE